MSCTKHSFRDKSNFICVVERHPIINKTKITVEIIIDVYGGDETDGIRSVKAN
jgi:hypothetical protein